MTRRLCAAGVTLALVLAWLSPAVAAQADPPAPVVAQLTLLERAPWVGADDAVPFRFRIDGDHTGATMRIRIHAPVDTVAELVASHDRDVGRVRFRSPTIPLPPTGEPTLALKTSSLPSDDPYTANLTEAGVHPVVFELLDADGAAVDTVRTAVLRLGSPDAELVAPDVVVLVDVAAPPSLAPDGSRSIDGGALAALAPVTDLLATHPGLPVIVAAVPDTVDALAASPAPAATDLLDALEARDVLELPYLPLSIGATRTQLLAGLLPGAQSRGGGVLAETLGATPVPGIWDPLEGLAPADVDLLHELGIERVLARPSTDDPDSDRDLDARDAGPWTPLGPVDAQGLAPLRALLVEPDLSDRLALPLGPEIDAAHDLLAEVLLRTRADGDTLLVRPGSLEPGSALVALLDLLDAPGTPVDIVGSGALVGAGPPADDSAPVAVTLPDGIRPALAEVAPDVLAAQGELDTLVSLLGERSARPDTLALQLLTAIAATTPEDSRVALVAAVRDRIDRSLASVTLTGETDLNLTSRRGTLPVSVANGNDVAVDVLIRVRSDRLAFPEGEVLEVRIAPGGERVDVEVEALATGSVPVFVELWTADDLRMLDSRRLNVRSTAISGVGLTISLGALVVLGAWWFRSWRRSRSADAAPGEAASPT